MKRTILIAFCAIFALTSKAQSNTDEITFLQSAYGMDKKQLIKEHMKITEVESVVFWKIYDEYEITRKEIGMKRANVIIEYAKNYSTLTNEKATELINNSLDNQIAYVNLLQKTFKLMSKELSPVRAAQFVQVENYLENIVRVALSDEIPLIGEFDKKK